MTTSVSLAIPIKPRVLIADDSRIVRATLIKHIEGLFEFREALDGEQAWEMLLLDPGIRVLITDLTMPKLDGYGLLQRIRHSKVSRIRDMPVILISGSDEQQERARAKAAGATELITKGIGTAQLLSRLEVLSRLVASPHDFERSLEVQVRKAPVDATSDLATATAFRILAEAGLSGALKNKRNFAILHICIGIKSIDGENVTIPPPSSVSAAAGRLLQGTVREADCVTMAGDAEFTVATGSLNFDAARAFAERICRTITDADLVPGNCMSFVASCGLASLCDDVVNAPPRDLAALCDCARRRSRLGMTHAITGVLGSEEEILFQQHGVPDMTATALPPQRQAEVPTAEHPCPDLATMLQWIKEGRRDEVLPHIAAIAEELRPLIDLISQQGKG